RSGLWISDPRFCALYLRLCAWLFERRSTELQSTKDKVQRTDLRSQISLRDCDLLFEINILDRVQDFDTFRHWSLKCLTAGNKAHSAAAFINDSGAHCLSQIAGTFGFTTRIDQATPSHVTVGDLVTYEVNGIISRKLFVDEFTGLSIRVAQSLFDG